MISKYGMSRESVHFGTVVESSLPLIADCELFNPLEDDLKHTCDRFRDKIGKFLMKRKRNKEIYKIGKEKKFFMYELVMKTNYTADSMLAEVCTGPFRIVHLDKGGAKLKNIKTGEEQAVSYEHIRKIRLEELLALLPQNFDSEITKTLDTYRYKKGEREPEGPNKEKMEEEKGHTRKLRSGRLYLMEIGKLGERTGKIAKNAFWRNDRIIKKEEHGKKPILINIPQIKKEFGNEGIKQQENKDISINSIRRSYTKTEKLRYNAKKKSSFSSETEGTIIVRIKEDNYRDSPGKRVKFKEILIHFYAP
jgi:hypothetical protein